MILDPRNLFYGWMQQKLEPCCARPMRKEISSEIRSTAPRDNPYRWLLDFIRGIKKSRFLPVIQSKLSEAIWRKLSPKYLRKPNLLLYTSALLTQSFILHNEVEAFPWVMKLENSNILAFGNAV